MKRKIFSALAVVLFMSSNLNANANIENQVSALEVDDCAVMATVLALQHSSPEVSYYKIWFAVYGACIDEQAFLP